MAIAVIVATTSCATTRASPAASNGKESANKSTGYWSAGNYHLVILSKKRMGNVPHKSPGNKGHKKETFQILSHLLCFCSLNLTFDNIFHDDVSVDSFVMGFGGEQDETSVFIHQWKFVL